MAVAATRTTIPRGVDSVASSHNQMYPHMLQEINITIGIVDGFP